MEAYLTKACWRAGAKLVAGFAVIGAVVGIRVVTATPAGIEAEIAELERFDSALAESAAPEADPADPSVGAEPRSTAAGAIDAASGSIGGPSRGGDGADLDRMVRCLLTGRTQFMRAADCATRRGALEELPPPEPEDPTAAQAAP